MILIGLTAPLAAEPACVVTLQPNATNNRLVCSVSWKSSTAATKGIANFNVVDANTGSVVASDAWLSKPFFRYIRVAATPPMTISHGLSSGHGAENVISQPGGYGMTLDRRTNSTDFTLFSTGSEPDLPPSGIVVITIPIIGNPLANFTPGTYTSHPDCTVIVTSTPFGTADPPNDLELTRDTFGNVILTWSATPGARYKVERSAALSGGWTVVPGMDDVAATAPTIIQTDVAAAFGNPKLFYRVALLPFGGSTTPVGYGLVPAGQFSMGDATDDGTGDEKPVHGVYLEEFYVGQKEVTLSEWRAVYTWATQNGYGFTTTGSGKSGTHPVQSVNWYDAVKWCNAKSELSGLGPCYRADGSIYRTGQSTPTCDWTASGYRLPTEAEWERAARGGQSGQRFPWGAIINHDHANYRGTTFPYEAPQQTGFHPTYETDGQPFTSPPGRFAANGYGLFDAAGNVNEWCWDWFSTNYYSDSSASLSPHGPDNGTYRVFRGGSWEYTADGCRVSCRQSNQPFGNYDDLGLRVVRRSLP